MKIKAYLALMVAAVLVPVIVFSTISMDMLLRAERDAALKGVRETARIVLVSVDRELTDSRTAVSLLARSDYLDKGDFAGFYQQALYSDRANSTWTALADEHGQQLLNTAAPFGTPMPPPHQAQRVHAALAAGVPQISNVFRGTVSKRLIVVVDFPVRTRSGKRYVISQGLKLEHFDNVIAQLNIPATAVVAVFDREGKVIGGARSVLKPGEDARWGLADAIRAGRTGVMRTGGPDGPMYRVLERSPLSGWTVSIGVPEAEIESSTRGALMVSMAGLFAALACASVAALFFARRLSVSIRHAARSAHALSRGEVIEAPNQSGVVEVDEVQAAITTAALIVRNEKQSRRLAEAEREKLFASEHAARTMAEQQNRAKDEFLAMLGHELRNPLAAIVNAGSVLGFAGMGAAALERAREIIARQARQLTRIVDDLLDVGRVHSGKILLARVPLRLDTIVETHVATLKATGRGAQHAITCVTAPAWVDADPTRIEQIVANLLDNAIKYTPDGGTIVVSVYTEGDKAVLAVKDSGVGISAELKPYVFDLFVQGTRALDRAQGGLGVGLALVRRLATMHGGQVAVHSDGAGKGSLLEVRLPLVQAPARDQETHAGVQSTSQTILLIEDNADAREMMTAMLESSGYRVVAAADGSEGLRLAGECRPDVALVDIGLPGIDGYEVARRMRADPALADIRLLALTGYGQYADQERALAAGFDVHMVKPVELAHLREVLEAHTEK